MYTYQSVDQLTLYPWGICVSDVEEEYGHQQEDKLWKNILEDLFVDFLRFFFVDAEQRFDLERGVKFENTELIAPTSGKDSMYTSRHVDKLARVFTCEGKETYVMIHLEVEGSGKEAVTERMYEYAWRVRCKHRRPVVAVAIYTDDDPDFCPDHYQDSYCGTEWRYSFNTCKILRQDEAALRSSDNPFAMVALAAKRNGLGKRLPEQERYDLKVELLKLLSEKGYPEEEMNMVLEFTGRMIRLKNKELNRQYQQTQEQITGRRTPMGMKELVMEELREEGRKEGEARKDHAFVQSLLQDTDFTDERVASLAGVSLAFVKEVKAGLNLAVEK